MYFTPSSGNLLRSKIPEDWHKLFRCQDLEGKGSYATSSLLLQITQWLLYPTRKRKTDRHLTNWRQFFMRLSCYWSWISSSHCQRRCGSADYFDDVMTMFIVNNRTDSLKTDINLFFTVINCRIERARSLTRRMNFQFMCLSAYWP